MLQLGTVPNWERMIILNKLGKQTIHFDNPPTIVETASIVGPKEAEGPMAILTNV